MSELTQEQFDELPDYAKTAFVQDGDKYVPAKDAKLKQTLDDLDKKKKQVEDELASLRSQMSEYEKRQQQEIERARAEALEKARTSGDTKAIEERYQQQMEDLRKQVAEETRNSVLKEVAQERAQEKAKTITTKIGAELGVDSDAGEALAELISRRVEIDPESGKEIYYDAQGSALSVDRAGFIERLRKESRFSRLIKSDTVTKGGGNANGSGAGGASSKKFGEMTGAELKALREQDPAKYQRMRDEFYSN